MAKPELSGDLSRRVFLAGAGTAAVVGATVAQTFPAMASLTSVQDVASTKGIEITGRITNALGQPHKGAYVEILHKGILTWVPGATEDVVHVDAGIGPERIGVWTDDDGVFALHSWWSSADATNQAMRIERKQADILFDIKTEEGQRSQWNVLLDANPAYDDRAPARVSRPVGWVDRARSAQFIADFTV